MSVKHSAVPIDVEFTGGLESLFSSQRYHQVALPVESDYIPTVGLLIQHISDNHLSGHPKKDLFILEGTVRPGILVLVNDVDWELEGHLDCELKANDKVIFAVENGMPRMTPRWNSEPKL